MICVANRFLKISKWKTTATNSGINWYHNKKLRTPLNRTMLLSASFDRIRFSFNQIELVVYAFIVWNYMHCHVHQKQSSVHVLCLFSSVYIWLSIWFHIEVDLLRAYFGEIIKSFFPIDWIVSLCTNDIVQWKCTPISHRIRYQ